MFHWTVSDDLLLAAILGARRMDIDGVSADSEYNELLKCGMFVQ